MITIETTQVPITFGNRTYLLEGFTGNLSTKTWEFTNTFYEDDVLTVIKNLNRKGVYVDVGANVGNHSVFFATQCPCDRLIAIEPVREAYDLLLKNLNINGLGTSGWNIQAFNCAASDKEEKFLICVPDGQNWGQAHRVAEYKENCVEVRAAPLDCLLTEIDGKPMTNIAVVKIDVEKDEMRVLEGMVGVLERNKPILVIESQTIEELYAVSEFLGKYHYRKSQRYGLTPTYIWSVGNE